MTARGRRSAGRAPHPDAAPRRVRCAVQRRGQVETETIAIVIAIVIAITIAIVIAITIAIVIAIETIKQETVRESTECVWTPLIY